MMARGLVISAVASALLCGCVTVPTGPAVTVLPGSRKTVDEFRNDDIGCRSYAFSSVGGSAQATSDAAAGNTVAATALGAAAGAIIGAISGDAGTGAAIGAGTGLLFGGVASADAAGYSSYGLQRQYDAAYVQCMYARGHLVPSTRYGGTLPRYYSPAAPYAWPGDAGRGRYPPPAGAASGNYPPPGYPAPSGAASGNSPSTNYPAPAGAASGNYPQPGYPAPSSTLPAR